MDKSQPLFSSAQYAMIAHTDDKDSTSREDDSS